MSDIRIKTMYKDDRDINEFLGLKDIEYVDSKVGSMEISIFYKKVKKTTKKAV